jgi:hypothetical protein
MSYSELLAIVGTGNNYTSLGIKPDLFCSFYADKAVWVINFLKDQNEKNILCHTNNAHFIDDFFAMIALRVTDFVKDKITKEEYYEYYEFNEFENSFDRNVKIKDREWDRFYSKIKAFLSDIVDIKIIFIILNTPPSSLRSGYEALNLPNNIVLEKLKEYGISNYEICTSIDGKFEPFYKL